MRRFFYRFIRTFSAASYCLIVAFPIAVSAATLTLKWIENDPDAENYRLFQRTDGEAYNYSNWIYSGSDPSYTVKNLQNGVTYFFVVRAYSADAESTDSNEIEFNSDDFNQPADSDGDGVVDEPEEAPENQAPFAPELSEPADAEIVGLIPFLTTLNYVDPDGDAHARTRYQIALNSDFTMLVLDQAISQNQLTSFAVPDLILDADTTYFWRARYFDSRNGQSDWSLVRSFTTHDAIAAGDADENGLLDAQEVGLDVDLDGDGTPDALQDGLMCVNTTDNYNPYVAIKQVSGDAQVVAIRALTLDGLGLASTQPQHMTGLISFKLLLEPDVTTASITVLFSEPAPENAEWYKFNSDEGWQVYPNVAFSADRKSMTIILEDGGAGDQDGVCNGVIVDPSGLGYERLLSNGTYAAYSDQTACFISTSMRKIE